MDKRFLVILAVIAVVIGAVFFVSSRQADAPGSRGTLTNHIEGKTDSKVTLTEYGDFQCPACASYYQALKDTTAKYQDRVAFQFRNFPLFQIHPNAIAAARAAEAADLQGKYWQMHDTLYLENVKYINGKQLNQTYSSWVTASNPQSFFESYAKALSLDSVKFKTDYKSSLVNDRVQADIKEGNRLGISSTPTFFINGKKISNPDPTVEGFSKVIDAELAKTGQ